MSNSKTKNLLSNLGDVLLIIGNTFSKVFLFIPASILIRTIPQSILILGNTSWATSNAFGPQAQREKNKWYGFAGYNTQQIMAASLGALAATLTIASFFIPVFLPLATWVAFLGNVIWVTSEYHRNKNKNPNDTNETIFKQQFYWRYSLLITAASLITAINVTLIFIFPSATLLTNKITTSICAGFFISGFINRGEGFIRWMKLLSSQNKPEKIEKDSCCPTKSCLQPFKQHLCFKSLFQPQDSRNPRTNPVESSTPRSP